MTLAKFAISLLTTLTILASSTIARADTLVSNGGGGEYRYELWRTIDNTRYYLKIWQWQKYRKSEPAYITSQFASSRDALDYFDCEFAEKPLPSCSR